MLFKLQRGIQIVHLLETVLCVNVTDENHGNAQRTIDIRLSRILDRSVWSDHENAAYDAEMLRRDEAVMEFDAQHPVRPLSAIDEVRRNYLALSTPRAVEQLFCRGDVLFDSGSNCCISNDETDFCALHLAEHHTLGGLAGELTIQGYGLVSWTFAATDRIYRILVLPCNFVPTAKQRIASPQIMILQTYPDETISVTHNSLSLSGRTNESTYGPYFPENVEDGPFAIVVPILEDTNLPIKRLYSLLHENGMNYLVRESNKPEDQVLEPNVACYGPVRWDDGGWESDWELDSV